MLISNVSAQVHNIGLMLTVNLKSLATSLSEEQEAASPLQACDALAEAEVGGLCASDLA